MSLATLSALAVLESPRRQGNTIFFDAQIFVGNPLAEDQDVITASLRYYNEKNMEFEDVGFYFIQASVACMEPEVNVHSDTFTHRDFQLVGDIISILPTETQTQQRAFVHICGPVHSVDTSTSSFEIHANQYTAAIREANQVKQAQHTQSGGSPTLGSICSFIPVSCSFPNSARWQKKPVVKVHHTVLITGFLTGCVISDNASNTPTKFLVDIESVTLLGRSIPEAPRTAASPVTPSPVGSTKFKFARWGSTSPSANVLGKRRAAPDTAVTVPNKSSAPPSSNLRSRAGNLGADH